MQTQLSVTLAIPCFNTESFIKDALDSIASQSVAPQEILIIDDGSTDNTQTIVKKFPHVRLIIHEQNRGIAGSRNSAWQAATSKIIIFMDADGIADPLFIEKILAQYNTENVAGVGGMGIESIQENIYDRWRKEILFQHWGKTLRGDVPFLFGLCSSYRISVLEEIGGFKETFRVSGEDMDAGFRIHAAGYQLVYTPDAIVQHQRRDTKESIQKMAYRHCFWGFLAQRINNNFQNKVSTADSLKLVSRHIFIDGCLKGSLSFSFLSIKQHLIMAKAWLDAKKSYTQMIKFNTPPTELAWEGHNNPQ